MLERTLKISRLYDFYGKLLTQRQREIISLYYFENYSLGEISSTLSISRQAIFDHLQRAEKSLFELEDKLNLVAQDALMRQHFAAFKAKLKSLDQKHCQKLWADFLEIEKTYGG